MKVSGDPIAMITAYDATFATLVDEAGVDMILVGDSLGMVVQGRANDVAGDARRDAVPHLIVARAAPLALVVGDLPFRSYRVSAEQAVASSIELIQAGAEAVKLEGGVSVAEHLEAITRVDIPVVGHIGLTPQSYHRMGGHRVQGRTSGTEAGQRERLIEDAFAVEQAGAFAVVIEGVPRDLAAEITGQAVDPDDRYRRRARLRRSGARAARRARAQRRPVPVRQAIRRAAHGDHRRHGFYVSDVKPGAWPDDEHSFH